MPSQSKSSPIALRIELLDIEPMIWRRIFVSNVWTFATLHNYLQWVMGWQDSHPHEFRIADHCIAPDWWIAEISGDHRFKTYEDEKRSPIAGVVRELGIGGELTYHYDMGDDWVHRIVIESPPPRWIDLELRSPQCLAGENACPPEDVGGPDGYQHFLECLADASNKEHADMLEWIGGAFDPKGFDLNRLNRDWKPGKRGGR